MSNYKAVCIFDLDGTLLNEKSQVDRDVASAIHALRDGGVLPVIATGRSIGEVTHAMEATGIDSIVGLNGQVVHAEGKKIFSKSFRPEFMERFRAFAHSLGHDICFYNGDGFWAEKKNKLMETCYDAINSPHPEEIPGKYKTELVELLMIISEDPELDQKYQDAFPELGIYRTTKYSIDTISAETSKATGIQHLIRELGLEHLPTYAFGDGLNDVPMFSAVDYGIAMGNAHEKLKSIADYVTASHVEGGLVQAFERYGLLY
ncbi:MAG: Cof-type HAD-IIB family hydrolase [Lactobacillales bacterium]|jgi:Cof subfamily protein (haloacid dehalogenase superfamily)|nr:Cof-type HAD-IIB family hydrolase [Lactobacillales bacterium]